MNIKHADHDLHGHTLSTFEIQHQDDDAPIIHFSGANGFPVAMYDQFLKQFAADYQITAVDCRATSQTVGAPPRGFGLGGFADDLIKIIEDKHQQPVIGMGHSFGAHVTAIAAGKRPDLFSKLVLIEPASLPKSSMDYYYRLLPKSVLHRFQPMIKRTENRQRIWQSREAFYQRYHNHPTFRKFTEHAMNAYTEHGLREHSSGDFELVFHPQWEAYIFSNVEFIWKNLKKTDVPCLFLKAEHSNLYSSETFESENKRLNSNHTGIELADTHHLIPLEKPAVCYSAVNDWLNN